MAPDVSYTYIALAAQRAALTTAADDLAGAMESAHGTETGVQAPVGRTSLRESLEGAIGATRAQLRLGEDDVAGMTDRLLTIESQVEELDLRLGSGWEELSLW